MHFITGKTELLKELSFIQGVVEKKNTIPILSNLLLEAAQGKVRIKGTDLDVSISTACDAEVKGEGAICIQAKKLFEIVRALPEAPIEVKCGTQDQVTLSCERSKFKMLGLDKGNFPEVPEFKGPLALIPADTFQAFIARTIFAVTNEESRYALNGAKFELSGQGLRMVATDGHRLSFIEKTGRFGEEVSVNTIIPRKTLSELLKLSGDAEETIEFGKDENHLFFKIGKRLLVSKTLNGQFPNYEMVLPKDNRNKILLESERLSGAVRRVALMADERSHAIKFEIGNQQLNISAQASDIGEAGESLPIEYQGEQIVAGFNAIYLNEFFSIAQDAQISLELKDGNSQALLRPVGELGYDFRYVIMPMRL